jgi:2-enoate reductase
MGPEAFSPTGRARYPSCPKAANANGGAFGRRLKQAVDAPIILAGRLDDPETAIDALNGCCDLVSYGRPLLADPFLERKIQTGHLEDVRPCLSCHDGCMGRIARGLPLSCAVNPACGREADYGIVAAPVTKQVLVVGGGLAGMETARVCALRGHEVTLVEAGERLGGNIIPGCVPDFKVDDRRLIAWYETQLRNLGVEILLRTKADAAYVEASGAEAVVVATGSSPIMPDFGRKNHVCTAADILTGKETSGEAIVVIGGGLVGCETALWLAEQGKKVAVVEMLPEILGGEHGMPFMNYEMLTDLLAANHVDIYRRTRVLRVNDDSVTVEMPGGVKELPADTVMIAVGYRSEHHLQDDLRGLSIPVYNVGDSRQVKNIMQAIWDAYEVARAV